MSFQRVRGGQVLYDFGQDLLESLLGMYYQILIINDALLFEEVNHLKRDAEVELRIHLCTDLAEQRGEEGLRTSLLGYVVDNDFADLQVAKPLEVLQKAGLESQHQRLVPHVQCAVHLEDIGDDLQVLIGVIRPVKMHKQGYNLLLQLTRLDRLKVHFAELARDVEVERQGKEVQSRQTLLDSVPQHFNELGLKARADLEQLKEDVHTVFRRVGLFCALENLLLDSHESGVPKQLLPVLTAPLEHRLNV